MNKNKEANSKIRMLLIEDDEDAMEAMTLTLGKFGVVVTATSSGGQGVVEWQKGGLDVVVSDIRMQGLTGVGVLRAIRAQDEDFPVILMTAYEQIDTAIEALRLGAQDYILKPVTDIEILLLAVRKAVSHHRLLLEHRAMSVRLKSLASELLSVEEKERRQLADDLHDSLGPNFATVKMKLECIADMSCDDKVKDLAREGAELVSQILQQTRNMVFDLSPPVLYDFGLEAALESLVAQMRKTYIQNIQYCPAPVAHLLTQNLNIVLFRAVREVLNNAIKYARAKQISLSLSAELGTVFITIEDDGIGFDVEAVTSYHGEKFSYGLFSVREQLASVGGSLDIISAKGEGTKAVIKVRVSVNSDQVGGQQCR